MKIKLISLAALAVCGSSAFAAGPLVCANPGTSPSDLVSNCVPEVTVYMAGASAQQPAIRTLLLTTDAVFDTTKAMAKVVAWSTGALGAKNTEIYVGTGSSKAGVASGKRIAVVYNTANGSFAGVKQMTEGKDTAGISGSTGGEKDSQGLLLAANAKLGKSLGCSQTTATDIPTFNCTGGNPFNYVTTAPAGGVVGVQLALADVAPAQAAIGVLATGAWTSAKFPMTPTAMQGFGVIVNDKALNALIKREVNAGRLLSTCLTTPALTGYTITAACQPNVSHADMAALISGRATAALISGDGTDTTKIAYNRRVDFSGTQASSNIQFGGQAATEGFKAADITGAAPKLTATGWLTLAGVGSAPNTSGDYELVSSNFISRAKVSSSGVISAVSGTADKDFYSFGVVSLEKVWNQYAADQKDANDKVTVAKSALTGASYVKIGGISPNFDAAGNNDLKHRVGMLNGYPFQYEMVAIKNASNSKTPMVEKVVNNIVDGLQNPSFNLAGLAYLGTPAVDATASEVAKYAKFTRGGLGNNYAPLNVK